VSVELFGDGNGRLRKPGEAGAPAATGPLALTDSLTFPGNPFEAGRRDVFRVTAPVDVGALRRLRVTHRSRGLGAPWHLARVHVVQLGSGHEASFPCDAWISKKWAAPHPPPARPSPYTEPSCLFILCFRVDELVILCFTSPIPPHAHLHHKLPAAFCPDLSLAVPTHMAKWGCNRTTPRLLCHTFKMSRRFFSHPSMRYPVQSAPQGRQTVRTRLAPNTAAFPIRESQH